MLPPLVFSAPLSSTASKFGLSSFWGEVSNQEGQENSEKREGKGTGGKAEAGESWSCRSTSLPHLSMSAPTPGLSIPQLSDGKSVPEWAETLQAVLHPCLCWFRGSESDMKELRTSLNLERPCPNQSRTGQDRTGQGPSWHV